MVQVRGHRADKGDPTAVRKSSATSGEVQLDKTILEITERKGIISNIHKGTLYNRFGCNMEFAKP